MTAYTTTTIEHFVNHFFKEQYSLTRDQRELIFDIMTKINPEAVDRAFDFTFGDEFDKRKEIIGDDDKCVESLLKSFFGIMIHEFTKSTFGNGMGEIVDGIDHNDIDDFELLHSLKDLDVTQIEDVFLARRP